MNRLRLIRWPLTCQQEEYLKSRITKLFLLIICLLSLTILSASSAYNVHDQANLLNKKTIQLIKAKNGRYLQTKEQPQIMVKTVRRVNKLMPEQLNKVKKRVYIVIGQSGKKRNVQIYSSKDLHGIFTADTRSNIIRGQVDNLHSKNKKRFNQGLRFVFKACSTAVDKHYQYALDKYDLTNSQQAKISHPHRIALPLALVLALLISGLVYFLRRIRKS